LSKSIETELLERGLVWAFSMQAVSCGVWFPLWCNFKILFHVLMSDKKVDITKMRCFKLSLELKGSNENFLSSHFYWFVGTVDIVKGAVGWNGLEIIQELSFVVFRDGGLEFTCH